MILAFFGGIGIAVCLHGQFFVYILLMCLIFGAAVSLVYTARLLRASSYRPSSILLLKQIEIDVTLLAATATPRALMPRSFDARSFSLDHFNRQQDWRS
jgi:hypothetical protein